MASSQRNGHSSTAASRSGRVVYVRVAGPGALLPSDDVRQAGFLVRNAQRVSEKFLRTASFALASAFVLFVRGARPTLGVRALCASLRGLSRDRLDVLGQEYYRRHLLLRLDRARAKQVRDAVKRGERVVLVSGWLDHVVRPLAKRLGVKEILCNRLEFRDDRATGRLLDPVVTHHARVDHLAERIQPTTPPRASGARPIVVYDGDHGRVEGFSARAALSGAHVLLVGVTGFIGKVWLVNILRDVPDIAKVYLLVRRKGKVSGQARFDRVRTESPPLAAIDPAVLAAKVEVVEGDLAQPDLGLDAPTVERMRRDLDVLVNSGGLTEFNPDVRASIAANIDSTIHTIDFIRGCDHASLLHLSTVYVAGRRAGRIPERVEANYNPGNIPGFDAEAVIEELRELVRRTEAEAQTTAAVPKTRSNGKPLTAAQRRKAEIRWLRKEMAERGTERALHYGWTNTYTFTKSLAESLLATRAADLPIAVARPSIVETSHHEPFPGWNEGVNTSAPLSWLCSTLFRQLPTKRVLRLDVIPVDLVTRGMNLIAAALIRRVHQRCYQLATSCSNPCDVARTIELTALAHRKHYRDRPGLDAWLRTHNETIPVSMKRYKALSAPRQKAVVRTLRRVLPLTSLKRTERNLDRVEKLIELFEPFIHDNDYAFEADHISLLHDALPPDEVETFGYDVAGLDWLEYWTDIHIPALRKWSYPLIEGRPVEA